jgi:MFS family permease
VTWSIGSALQARVHQPASRRLLLPAGFTLTALALTVVIAPLLFDLPSALVFVGWTLVGLGIGLSFPILSVLLLQLSPPEQQGSNTSSLQLSDALTSSAALALAGLLFDPVTRQVLPVLLLALGLVGAAALLSPRAQPAGT